MDEVDHPDSLPEWWAQNERIREERDLPPYRPPRFEDGVYTHKVIPKLESEFKCTIQFAGTNTTYLDDWAVEVNGQSIFSIGRHRDETGNTVYEFSSNEFEDTFRAAVRDDTERSQK
jgi:hypothetical protein